MEDAQSADTRPRKRQDKKACTGCRQQKLRCDAFESEYTKPCSRCQKFGLACKIEGSFKRTHKRMKLAEMEQRVEMLKCKLSATAEEDPTDPAKIDERRVLCSHMHNCFDGALPERASRDHNAGNKQPAAASLQMLSPSSITNSATPIPESAPATLNRSVSGVNLSGADIDEIFAIYFSQFHPVLPLLDPHASPDFYYEQSDTLFWTIIAVASRRYAKDPSLLDSLRSYLTKHALTLLPSMCSYRSTNIQYIQALLLLCTWPFPSISLSKDITYVLSGICMQVGMQIGLHLPLFSEDFVRVKLNLSEEDIKKRAELWAYCVLVNQRTGCACGLPLIWSCTSSTVYDRHPGPQPDVGFPHDLCFQMRLQKLHSEANAAISETLACCGNSPAQEATRNTLVKAFLSQLKALEHELPPTKSLNHLYYDIVTMLIRQFHFYNDSYAPDLAGLTALYEAAIAIVSFFGVTPRPSPGSSHYMSTMFLLAMFTMLKLLKSSFATYIDADAGKAVLFAAVETAKTLSVNQNDLVMRSAVIVTQLWPNDRAFRSEEDGMGGWKTDLRIRVRSRMSMSLLYDCVWWWRKECGHPLPPAESVAAAAGEDPARAGGAASEVNILQEAAQPAQLPGAMADGDELFMTFLDTHFLGDMDWMAHVDFTSFLDSSTFPTDSTTV